MNRKLLIRVLVAMGALAAALSGCVADGTSSAGPSPDSILVTADMFSGRPNPTWALSADEASSLTHCLQAGTLGDVPHVATPGDLGFRSFQLAGLPAPLTYSRATVTADAVTAETGQGDRVVSGCQAAYALLRASAKSHLTDTEYQAIPEEPTS